MVKKKSKGGNTVPGTGQDPRGSMDTGSYASPKMGSSRKGRTPIQPQRIQKTSEVKPKVAKKRRTDKFLD